MSAGEEGRPPRLRRADFVSAALLLLNVPVLLGHTRLAGSLGLTSMGFTSAPGLILWGVFNLLVVSLWVSTRLEGSARRKWIFRGVSLGLCLLPVLGLEAYLRHTEQFANYSELNGGTYASPYDHRNSVPWLLVYPPHAVLEQRRPEFAHEIRTNADGLRDIEHPVAKAPGEQRIVAIGDSFTMGAGAKFDETWLQVLQRRLDPSRKRYRVISGGVGGSDPVYEAELLRRRLLKYSPDLVLLVVNASDLSEIAVRGGIDRFDAQGFVHPRPPRSDFLIRHSHLARAVFLGILDYDWDLQTPAERERGRERAFEVIVKVAVDLRDLGRAEGFKLLVVAHPTWREVQEGPPSTLHPLAEPLAAAGVPFLDLLEHFRAEIPRERLWEFFYHRDQHYRPSGYRVFAAGVEPRVRALLEP